MGIHELKKRNRTKLFFGGVKLDNIKKYVSPEYIRRLLTHRREFLERPVDLTDPVGIDDVDVVVDDQVDIDEPNNPVVTVGDVQPMSESTGENPALDQGTNPPSAIDDALATVTNLTNQIASDVPSPIVSSAIDIHPMDAALKYISELVESLPVAEESDSDSESASENPAISALNLTTDISAELAAPSVATINASSTNPTDEALDDILKFTQSLVSPLSTPLPLPPQPTPGPPQPTPGSPQPTPGPPQPTPGSPQPTPGPPQPTPGSPQPTPGPPQPNTSSFFSNLNVNGMIKQGLDSMMFDEDMTKYEVEEYTTALGSDEKRDLRKTNYDSKGEVSGKHMWIAPVPAPKTSKP
jgi:hypothetical protein